MGKVACLAAATAAVFGFSLQSVEAAYTILPPDAIVDGKSIADWTGAWWTWALQAPAATNPVFNDPSGTFAHVDNSGPVFFIAGNTATRSFTVPAGRPILLPLINVFDTEPDTSFTLAEREAAADAIVGTWVSSGVDTSSLSASIDGTAVANPPSYSEVTGFQDWGPVQASSYANVAFGLPVGLDLSPSKSAGYWLMVTGLSPGVHQLDFGGSSNAFEIPPNCCDSGTFPDSTTETIDTITVTTPEPASVWSMLLGVLGLSVFRPVRRTRSPPTTSRQR